MMPTMIRRLVLLLAVAGALLATAAPALGATSASSGAVTTALQRKLIRLRYLQPGLADGIYGNRTVQAVMAFQGWVGLPRTGYMDSASWRALKTAKVPVSHGHNRKHMEVYISKQVLLLIGKLGHVKRAIHVSTAGVPGYYTPTGIFHIYRKELMSWSNQFQTWLPYADYFTGGFAFHEYPDVPGVPASHGCIRIADGDAQVVWGFAAIGTRVTIR
jgi:Putative peptidoglycan binding domain/L,D-transpeptidase catalytic domain